MVLLLFKAAKAGGNAENMVATRARTTNTEMRRSETDIILVSIASGVVKLNQHLCRVAPVYVDAGQANALGSGNLETTKYAR